MNYLIIFCAKYLYLAVAGLAVIYFLMTKKRKHLAILTAVALPVIYLLSLLAGHLYIDPRPFVAGHFAPLIPHGADNGFVSDHALLTSAIAAVVFVFNKKLGVVLFILAAIVGTARVLAGLHHTIDIVGAFAISILVVYACGYLFKICYNK